MTAKQQDMSVPTLISTIKTHLAKGDRSFDDAERHYRAAGAQLRELKARKPVGVTWPSYVREHFNLSQQRADELIRIADGRATVEETRAIRAKSERARRQRERPTTRVVETPVGSPPPPPVQDDQNVIRNRSLLNRATEAVRLAKFDDLHDLKISKDVEAAVFAAGKAWNEVVTRVVAARNSEAA